MPAVGEWIAAENTPGAHDGPFHETKATDGLVRVFATGGTEAAHAIPKKTLRPPMVGRKRALVDPDEPLTALSWEMERVHIIPAAFCRVGAAPQAAWHTQSALCGFAGAWVIA